MFIFVHVQNGIVERNLKLHTLRPRLTFNKETQKTNLSYQPAIA